jgi:hypothetical protein
MNTPNEDPYGSIEIAKMQVNRKKHQREYIMGKVGLGGSKSTINIIGIEFKKINANGVYQIVPSTDLSPGEYVFSNSQRKAFLFSLNGEERKRESTPEQVKEAPHPHDPLGEAIYKEIQKRKAKEAELNNANPRIETNTTEPVKNIPAVKEETKITPPKPTYQEPVKEEVKIVTPAPIEATPTRQVKVTYSRTEEIPAPKPAPVPVAPATKTVSDSGVEELIKWKKMLDAGVITQAEYEAKKKQVLGN